jgi:hypothetical protein
MKLPDRKRQLSIDYALAAYKRGDFHAYQPTQEHTASPTDRQSCRQRHRPRARVTSTAWERSLSTYSPPESGNHPHQWHQDATAGANSTRVTSTLCKPLCKRSTNTPDPRRRDATRTNKESPRVSSSPDPSNGYFSRRAQASTNARTDAVSILLRNTL